MRRAPDVDDPTGRLRALADHFRRQESFMQRALQQLQRRLERWHREASFGGLDGDPVDDDEEPQRRCRELQQQYDDLAVELVHVRLAIAGADEELVAATPRRLRA